MEHGFVVLRGKIKVSILAANGKDLTLCYYISSGILGDIEFVQENKIAPAALALYFAEEPLCSYILMAEHNQMFTEILSDVSKSIGISYRHLFLPLNNMCQRRVLEKGDSGFVGINREY